MIVVERQDRIGNQLFQYAFGLAAAHRLGTDFVMADEELIELFLLGGRSRAAEHTPQYPLVTINNEDYDEPEEVLGELRDNTHYRGWFQSERFFADVADEVRHAFRLRPEHEEPFLARFAGLLVLPYVCCHVRATDYATFASGIVLPPSYYRASLARVAPDPGTPIVFVGDDLAEVRVEFASVDHVRFEANDEAIDFQLLMHADAVVVSNSTFAWWAAWLNTRPGKRVFAPRHWVGFNRKIGWHNSRLAKTGRRTRRGWEFPPHVIPEDWTKVPVRRSLRATLSPSSLKSSLALFVNNSRARLHRT